MQVEIYDLLYNLGVTANYTGFFHTAYAVQLCTENPERLLLVTKWVYPDVAKRYGTNWKAVERNIRTVGAVIWTQNRPLLEQLARRPLEEKPYTAQLLSILSAHYSSPAVHGLGKPVALSIESHNMRAVDQTINESTWQVTSGISFGFSHGRSSHSRHVHS